MDWREIKRAKGIESADLSAVVHDHLEAHGPVKGLRFEQVNALTIMCDWEFIAFGDKLEKIYLEAILKITNEEAENDTEV
ncbi:TPA: hypothetical protein ACGO3A_002314 [Streptococcus suis]